MGAVQRFKSSPVLLLLSFDASHGLLGYIYRATSQLRLRWVNGSLRTRVPTTRTTYAPRSTKQEDPASADRPYSRIEVYKAAASLLSLSPFSPPLSPPPPISPKFLPSPPISLPFLPPKPVMSLSPPPFFLPPPPPISFSPPPPIGTPQSRLPQA